MSYVSHSLGASAGSCPNDTVTNRPSTTTGPNCLESDVPNCPSDYSVDGGMETSTSTSWVSYCFGDFITNKDRYRRRCYKSDSNFSSDPNDLANCCFGTIDDHNCKPGYCVGGSKCSSFLPNYCSDSSKLDSDSRCQDFCQQNQCSITNYCTGENLDTDYCQQLCFQSDGYKYDCGLGLASYCAKPENQDKDFCQCYLPSDVYEEHYEKLIDAVPKNAQSELRAVINRQPYCSYTKCSSQNNYWPRKVVQCPNVNVCIQNATIDNTGQIVMGGGVDIQQNCPDWICSDSNPCTGGLTCVDGSCVTPPPGSSPVPSPDPTPEELPGQSPSSPSPRKFIVIGAVALVVLLLLILLLVIIF